MYLHLFQIYKLRIKQKPKSLYLCNVRINYVRNEKIPVCYEIIKFDFKILN